MTDAIKVGGEVGGGKATEGHISETRRNRDILKLHNSTDANTAGATTVDGRAIAVNISESQRNRDILKIV